MNKNQLKIRIILRILIMSMIISIITTLSLVYYQEYRVEHEIKIVKLERDKIEVYEENVYLQDIIKEINGNLIDNPLIVTKKLGEQTIRFSYITNNKIKVPYEVKIEVVDQTPPLITTRTSLKVEIGEKENIASKLFCGDNFDDNPTCIIEGEYDVNTLGKYPVKFIGRDSSNNESIQELTLEVIPKQKTSNQQQEQSVTYFEDIKNKYKNENTQIGIDVSHWQGKINFQKIKDEGVEFAYIRVGRGNGIGKEFIEDTRFQEYIKGFNEVGIPVGVYFFSYANSVSDAKKEAKWVLDKIKDYKIDLEIVFDWENWDYFQEYDLSFHKLTELSNAFRNEVKKHGYEGMLYGSKFYLENVFFKVDYPVWLAHYTEKTTYEGEYVVWQLCEDGKVKGIDDNLVDINIRYKK